MREININNEIVIIREAVKSDAEAMIAYLGIIGGESDFLTFGEEELKINIEQEKAIIENAINKENALFIVAEVERKINLRVRTDNAAGIKLYKKLGFLEEGKLKRDFCIDGEFYDSLLMGLLIDANI